MKNEFDEAASAHVIAPAHLTIYNPNGVYQKLCLCNYLRELPEDPVALAEDIDDSRHPASTGQLPVGC
jgi:hypothetical protein